METGERIKALRKRIGLSAEDLAAAVGISPATMYRYENGDTQKLSGNIIAEIAMKLHTSVNYLLGTTDDPEIPQGFFESYGSAEEARKAWEAAKWSALMDGDIMNTEEERRLLRAYRKAQSVYKTVALELLEDHPAE